MAVLAASTHKPFLRRENFPTIEHDLYLVEQGSELQFGMAILLRSNWDSIFELHPHPFLFAGPLKINIFSYVVAAQVLDLTIILVF